MMERMLEAERKDYWQADPERLKQLVEQYIDVVNNNDLVILNDAVKEHVNELAEGYGLAPLVAKTMAAMAASADAQKALNNQQLAQQQSQKASQKAKAEQQVEGQKLEKQTVQSIEPDDVIYYSLAGILLLIIFGALWQVRTAKPNKQQIYLLATKQNHKIDKAA